MIPYDWFGIIRFSPDDVPELMEINPPKPKEKKETPPPADWRPFGEEW